MPVFVAPPGDHEIHGDKGNLEEDVEQDTVEGCKGTDRRSFQKKYQSNIGARTFTKRRRIDHSNQEKNSAQQHQRQTDPINSNPVGGTDGRYPLQLFDLGKACTARTLKPHGQSTDQCKGGGNNRYDVYRTRCGLRKTQNQHRADQRQKQGERDKW